MKTSSSSISVKFKWLLSWSIAFSLSFGISAQEGEKWIVYEGGQGPGLGKHIVFLSGDEEYRSEEAMPALAKVFAYRHGFKCTVLFAINPETGKIDPDYQKNIPGLEALKNADLMIMSLRFRALPEEQMIHILEYLNSGKPIIGLRTSTHAFQYPEESPFYKYSARSDVAGWEGGFGRQVLGETWVSHHGHHGRESTQGLVNGLVGEHPILTDVTNVWGPTDVYGINDITGDETVLLYGQSLSGMKQGSMPNFHKSILPVAWIKNYTTASGKTSRIFTTTMGAAVDLENEGLRRLLINAAYWAVELDVPRENEVRWVGDYQPRFFGFGEAKKGLSPNDFKVDDALIALVLKEEADKPGIASTIGHWEYEIKRNDESYKGVLTLSQRKSMLEGSIRGSMLNSELSNIRYENGHLIFNTNSSENGPVQADLKFEGDSFKGVFKFIRNNRKLSVEGKKKDN